MVANVQPLIDPREHVGLAFKAASKYARSVKGRTADFVGIAYVAMARAAETFDPGMGCRWSTHAMAAMFFQLHTQTRMLDTEARRTPRGMVVMSRAMSQLGEKDRDEAMWGDEPERVEVEPLVAFQVACMHQAADEVPHGSEIVSMRARGLDGQQIGEVLGIPRRRVNDIMVKIRRRARAKFLRGEPHAIGAETAVAVEVEGDAVGAAGSKRGRKRSKRQRGAGKAEPAGALRAVHIRPPQNRPPDAVE